MDTTKVASSREAVRPEMFSPVVFFVLVPDQKKETRKGNGKLSDCQPRGLVGLSRVEQEMFPSHEKRKDGNSEGSPAGLATFTPPGVLYKFDRM